MLFQTIACYVYESEPKNPKNSLALEDHWRGSDKAQEIKIT